MALTGTRRVARKLPVARVLLAPGRRAKLEGVTRTHGVLAVGVATLLTATAAWAHVAATADLSVKWFLVSPPKPVAGQPFRLQAGTSNAGPDAGNARVNIQLPAGVSRLGGSFECSQDGQVLHCDEFPAPVGDDGSGTATFVAAEPGTYTFVVFLDHLSATDSNAANNTDSITVTVASKPVTAGALTINPAHPRAGTRFKASLPVDGADVTAVTCTTNLGRAVGTTAGGRAICSVVTPRSSRGLVLHGRLRARAGDRMFTRPFSFRLR